MPAFTPFSDEDFETLGNWLVRRAKGISDIVELEGFLTAIVIGPNTLSPLAWLPKVWGGKRSRIDAIVQNLATAETAEAMA